MFIKKKNYDRLKEQIVEFKETIKEQDSSLFKLQNELDIAVKKDKKIQEVEKILNEDYGDSLEFLQMNWSKLMWLKDIDASDGADVIEAIKEDVKLMIKVLLSKKKK